MLKKTVQNSGLFFLWISGLVFVADWATKALALTYLLPYLPHPVFTYFNLTLAFNTGAAFSFLDQAAFQPNRLFSIIAATVSVLILLWLARLSRKESSL
ncbi:MAG TPA: signal peptidase II, partial [Gammaproteobacteria bacterium]|nr:signal peptidase II [Gammaproteobacteria bacterium]